MMIFIHRYIIQNMNYSLFLNHRLPFLHHNSFSSIVKSNRSTADYNKKTTTIKWVLLGFSAFMEEIEALKKTGNECSRKKSRSELNKVCVKGDQYQIMRRK